MVVLKHSKSLAILLRPLASCSLQATFIYDESWNPPSGNLITVWSPMGRLWSSGWEAHQIKYEPLPRSVIREPNTLYEAQ
jgi:hypothetical protein